MKNSWLILTVAAAAWPTSAHDLAPEYWFENVTATDDSVQQSLVFRTVPGVAYRVETSEDLTSWTPGEEIYGMGHEYVVPVREFTPPPSQPGSGGAPLPTAPARKTVSLMLKRSNGTDGGTVASWQSLDGGGGVTVLVEEDLVSGWDLTPLFWGSEAGYNFFIWHPSVPATPPIATPTLSLADQLFLSALVARLPAMNVQVALNELHARNTPPPAPPAPGSTKFWRVNADWSVDTDGDGSPDWAEFETMQDASHPSHIIANAFNADNNNDGIPDTPDADQDGIPDRFDADVGVNEIDWERTGAPRFAWFEMSPPADPWGYSQSPLHATDLGHVVYPYGLWSKGAYVPINRSGTGVDQCVIYGMNDLFGGQIVGYGNFDKDGDGYCEQGTHVFWSADAPVPVRSGDTFATMRFSWISKPGNFLGNDGSFVANVGSSQTPARWVIPWNGGDASFFDTNDWAVSTGGPDVAWGGEQANIGGILSSMPGFYDSLAFTPSGSIIACGMNSKPAIFRNGVWTVERSMPLLREFSETGFGVTNYPVTIWNDGRLSALGAVAPGLPDDWKQQAHLWDLSDDGNMLISKQTSGASATEKYALAIPFRVTDDVESTGVDAVSVTSTSPGSGIDDKLWIMAPAGGSNTVRFKTSANGASCPLNLTASPATFEPSTLTSSNEIVTVGAAESIASEEPTTRIANGAAVSITSPLGIKVMKKRIVTLAVYKVSEKAPPGLENNTADLVPTEEELKSYLNTQVFGPQLNVTFALNIVDEPLVIDWKPEGDAASWMTVGPPDQNSPDQQLMVDEICDELGNLPANIVVFLMGSNAPLGAAASGVTNRASRVCWVIGDSLGLPSDPNRYDSLAQVKRTIAHEIGHILVGYGHPDKRENPGQAELPGTLHTDRLMVSGQKGRTLPGTLLVKREWDEAEKELPKILAEPQ